MPVNKRAYITKATATDIFEVLAAAETGRLATLS